MGIKIIVKGFFLNRLPEKLLQPIKKFHYLRFLRNLSENDEVEFKVIRKLVRPGDCVIDVGANIGVYTKYLSELVGIHGHVFSIEPVPLTFDILDSNVRKLCLKNVELINCAISDIDGSVTMEIPLYESGGENFYQARIVYENSHNTLRRVRINSKPLDGLFSGLPYNISFIKCDVEGHELHCIKGAVNIIKKSKPAWLVEVSTDPDDLTSTASEVFKLLRDEGYEAFWFDGTNLNRRRFGEKSTNYLFLCGKHLQALHQTGLPSEIL